MTYDSVKKISARHSILQRKSILFKQSWLRQWYRLNQAEIWPQPRIEAVAVTYCKNKQSSKLIKIATINRPMKKKYWLRSVVVGNAKCFPI